ncbi:MAG TPA: hypothetical protein VEC60_09515 [Reyranella sp.]|nr:hypothetical protein [Reyranella sp.]
MLDMIRRFGGWLRATLVEKPFWSVAVAIVAVLALDAWLGGLLWPLIFALFDALNTAAEKFPPLMALFIALMWLAVGLGVIRLLILYINRTPVTGEDMTLHGAIDKIYKEPLALAVLLGLALLGLFLFMGNFVRPL